MDSGPRLRRWWWWWSGNDLRLEIDREPGAKSWCDGVMVLRLQERSHSACPPDGTSVARPPTASARISRPLPSLGISCVRREPRARPMPSDCLPWGACTAHSAQRRRRTRTTRARPARVGRACGTRLVSPEVVVCSIRPSGLCPPRPWGLGTTLSHAWIAQQRRVCLSPPAPRE